MSALADYFPSADCRQPALWSKILCCTRSQNPLALGKLCDGTDALQRKACSTVPAAGGRRWGHSSKTMSFPEPVRKPPQFISSKLHQKQHCATYRCWGARSPDAFEATWRQERLTMIFGKPVTGKDLGGRQHMKDPCAKQAQNLEFCFISGNVSSWGLTAWLPSGLQNQHL